MSAERPIEIIQLNCEGNLHSHKILSLLITRNPQAFLAQEVPEVLFLRILEETKMDGVFWPMVDFPEGHTHERLLPGSSGKVGLAIFSQSQIQDSNIFIYSDGKYVGKCDGPHFHNGGRRGLLTATFDVYGETMTVGTTHCRVTKDGKTEPKQLEEYERLEQILLEQMKHGLDLWTADTNAPAETDVGVRIREKFCVPDHGLISTLTALHRIKGLDQRPLNVDVIAFPKNGASKFRMVSPLRTNSQASDHVALIADLAYSF